MISGEKLAKAGDRFLGEPYSKMDCQDFVERCLRVCGLEKNLAGSNAWFREVKSHGEILTPEECTAKYGKVPDGAFLFILKQDGREPEKYKQDGLGNASHIGIVTNRTAEQMMAEVLEKIQDPEEREAFIKKVSHGNGAINSSSSRGCVCTSTFAGKAIRNGGWNRVGLWDQVDYNTGQQAEDPEPGQICHTIRRGDKGEFVIVCQEILVDLGYDLGPCGVDGDFGKATESAVKLFQRRHGLEQDGVVGPRTWAQLLLYAGDEPETYTVTIRGLTKEQAEGICKEWSGATMKKE